jgi:hypothetical protein
MISTKAVWNVILVEKSSGRKPLVEHIRIFGCIVWDHIPNDRMKQPDANIHACIMMGFLNN